QAISNYRNKSKPNKKITANNIENFRCNTAIKEIKSSKTIEYIGTYKNGFIIATRTAIGAQSRDTGKVWWDIKLEALHPNAYFEKENMWIIEGLMFCVIQAPLKNKGFHRFLLFIHIETGKTSVMENSSPIDLQLFNIDLYTENENYQPLLKVILSENQIITCSKKTRNRSVSLFWDSQEDVPKGDHLEIQILNLKGIC